MNRAGVAAAAALLCLGLTASTRAAPAATADSASAKVRGDLAGLALVTAFMDREIRDPTNAHLLGTWLLDGGRPQFVTFLPNASLLVTRGAVESQHVPKRSPSMGGRDVLRR